MVIESEVGFGGDEMRATHIRIDCVHFSNIVGP